MSNNFFEVLGVPEETTDAAVKAAYLRRVKETHPDMGGNAEDFLAVKDAFETLSTASKRSTYRLWLLNSGKSGSSEGGTENGIDDDLRVAAYFYQLDALKAEATRQLLIGILWAAGAVAVSGLTFIAARGGGHYLIFWGPIIFGGWRALRSISVMLQVSQARRHLLEQIAWGAI